MDRNLTTITRFMCGGLRMKPPPSHMLVMKFSKNPHEPALVGSFEGSKLSVTCARKRSYAARFVDLAAQLSPACLKTRVGNQNAINSIIRSFAAPSAPVKNPPCPWPERRDVVMAKPLPEMTRGEFSVDGKLCKGRRLDALRLCRNGVRITPAMVSSHNRYWCDRFSQCDDAYSQLTWSMARH